MSNYLTEAIEKIQGQRILVIGDMIADIYLNCSIARISREAPVLVLEQQEEKIVAGGAANVVNNAATLGGKVYAAGAIMQLSIAYSDKIASGLKNVINQRTIQKANAGLARIGTMKLAKVAGDIYEYRMK